MKNHVVAVALLSPFWLLAGIKFNCGITQSGYENGVAVSLKNGQTVTGRVTDKCEVVDEKGNHIGLVQNGEFLEKLGEVDKSSQGSRQGNQVSRIDSEGKRRIFTRDQEGNLCYDTTVKSNESIIPRGEQGSYEVPLCERNLDDAITHVVKMFDDTCNKEPSAFQEQGLYIKRNKEGADTPFMLKRADKSDGSATEVKLDFGNDDVAMILHPHQNGSWPSELDVITGLKYDSDVVIRDCETGDVTVFDHITGKVYDLINGKRIEKTQPVRNEDRKNDGHDQYEYENLETLRAKAKGLEGKNKELGAVVNNKNGPNGHKWVMRGEQPISFDDIVLGAPWQGKKNDTSIVVLKQPYFVFHTVFVSVEDGRVSGVCFDCGRPNQRAIESMAIGELICKDIEKQCGVKLKNDKRPHHRQYQWNGRGFRRIELRINNENDDTPGNASFFLLVDGGYGYHKYVDH